MPHFNTPDRTHRLVAVPHGERIEVSGTQSPGRWSFDLTATRSEGFVTVKICDRLVADLKLNEARDFALALLKAADAECPAEASSAARGA